MLNMVELSGRCLIPAMQGRGCWFSCHHLWLFWL